MPIDANIALGVKPLEIESPLNAMGKALSIRNAQQANQLGQMQMGEYQRKMQDQNALRATLAGFTPDMTPEAQVSALQRGGHLADARSLAESTAKVSSDQRAAEKAALESESKKLDIRGQVYGSVIQTPTPEAAQSAVSYLLQNKLVDEASARGVMAKIQADPSPGNIATLAQGFLNMSMSAKDQVEQKRLAAQAQETAGYHAATVAGTRRGQDIQAATARAGQDVTMRGQDMTADTARTEKADKTSEGERNTAYNANRILKAAKRIEAATKRTPDAEAPGVGEALTSSVYGLGGLTNISRGADRQIVAGAQEDVIDALLYLATGAAYSKEQAAGQRSAYLPKFTDKPEAKAEKKAALLDLIKGAKIRAGKAWTPELEQSLSSLTGGPPATPASSPQDDEALKWAAANPNDPRAAQIRQRLGK